MWLSESELRAVGSYMCREPLMGFRFMPTVIKGAKLYFSLENENSYYVLMLLCIFCKGFVGNMIY